MMMVEIIASDSDKIINWSLWLKKMKVNERSDTVKVTWQCMVNWTGLSAVNWKGGGGVLPMTDCC